jgi:NADH dehydrogenase FAD-containing subunit
MPEAIQGLDQRSQPSVVIIGAGMGGLNAARALRNAPVHLTVIDRMNHNLFQPLLYQVATSELTPGQIAAPIRGVLRSQRNTLTLLAEVTGIDTQQSRVFARNADREHVPVRYDYLIVATGARGSYFGHDEFERHAPGLKTIADAVAVRNKILEAFERAEAEADPSVHPSLLTFVLVGGGPAGVEMAGALAVLMQKTLRSEFRRIDPTSARVVLVDGADRLLRMVGPEASAAAQRRLEKLGVEVRVGATVDRVDGDGVIVGGKRIASKNVIWTAGVEPSPAGQWLRAETDRAGRVRIQGDLTVPGRPNIFVIGDTAALEQDGHPLPGVAQVAIQQGRYAAKVIRQRLAGKAAPAPFRYFDKGNLAVVGQGYAVLQTGRFHLVGPLAFLIWALIHVLYLAQASQRLSVFLQWAWTYLTRQRGSRLIVNHHAQRTAPLEAIAAALSQNAGSAPINLQRAAEPAAARQ